MFEGLKSLWNNSSWSRRVIFAAIAMALVVVPFGALSYSSDQDYQPLFTNLSPEDAGAVVQKLAESGTKYKLDAGGTAILVPTAKVYETRLTLASAGIPRSSGVGFELFDKSSSLGLSDAAQKVNQQRALQGELERTIAKLNGVEGARVLIAQSTDSLFLRDQSAPTASVLLKTKGTALTSSQVRTIANLVSSSVPKLKPEAITITDTAGTDYSSLLADLSTAGGTSRQLEIKRQYEADLTRKINDLLVPVFGTGAVSVKAAVDVNWDSFEKNATVLGDEPVVISKQDDNEQLKGGTTTTAGGIPGTSSNVPVTGGTTGTGTTSGKTPSQDYTNSKTTTNFDVSKSIEKTIKAPGSIKKLFVSVFIDKPAGDPSITPALDNAIKTAAGIDAARGDVISVVASPFNRESLLAQQKQIDDAAAAAKGEQQTRLIGSGVVALLAIGAAIFFLMRSRKPAMLVAGGDATLALPESLFATPALPRGDVTAQGQQALDLISSRSESKEYDLRSSRAAGLRQLAATNSEDFASAIRTMLTQKERA